MISETTIPIVGQTTLPNAEQDDDTESEEMSSRGQAKKGREAGSDFWDNRKKGLLYKFESFRKLIKVLGWCLLFIKKCRDSVTKKGQIKANTHVDVNVLSKSYINQHYLDINMIESAKKLVFRYAQECAFSEELTLLQNEVELDHNHAIFQRCSTKKRLFKLLAYWDNDAKLIRIRSRTPEFNFQPVVLPEKHQVSWLYLRQIHKDYLHCGVSETIFGM